jgi:hypothetical protein
VKKSTESSGTITSGIKGSSSLQEENVAITKNGMIMYKNGIS